MNEFLRKFGAEDNQSLYQKIKSNPVTKDEFDTLVNRSREYMAEDPISKPRLSNSSTVKNFVKDSNFWSSDKMTLLFLNVRYECVGYKEYKPNALSTEKILSDTLLTESAAATIMVRPAHTINTNHLNIAARDGSNHLEEQHKDLSDTFSKVDVSLLDYIIAEPKKSHSLTEGFVNYETIELTKPSSNEVNLPNQGESPILEGMQEFCEFYAAKEIQGKNFWEDNEEVKSLVNLSYTFLNIEHAGVLKLDEIGNVQKMETVAKGATASCTLYPSEICKGLVKDSAEQWVIFHNHPSGDTKASDADISLTTHIEKVSKLLNRPLIEHFIIAGENIFEFSKDPALVSELTKNAQESKTIYLEHQEELER